MKKFKRIFVDILFVSKLTKTKNKKIRIVLSVILANISVFCDITIILFFADFFQESSTFWFIDFIKDNIILLPLLVLIRFSALYLEKMNILSMQLEIESNLKQYFIKEVFSKGNYSTADAFFYVGQLSNHVSYFYNAITTSLNLFVQITVYLGYLAITNFNTLGIFLIGGLILYLPTKQLASLLRKYVDLSYHENKKLYEDIQKLIDNLYIIKIAKKSKDEISLFTEKVENYRHYQYRNFQFGTINSIIPPFFTLLVFSIVIAFSNFVSFITLEFVGIVVRLFQSVGEFNKTLGMVINSHVHLEKLHTVDKNKKVINSQYFKLNKSINPEIAIEFQDVSFNYMGSDSSIFKNLNIDILKNRHTIITGANGSGKSTFLGICAGVFYPESGTVNTYSNKYGYVGVTPLIFTDSLRNNLLYGNEYKIDDHNIIELIKKFQLFNESFDINLDKIVSNKSLSSGQMQKISFIRALLSKVDILILDESMSNLDSSTKELIYEILGKLELTIINSTHSTENLAYDVHFEIKMSNDIREVIIHN